MKRSFRSTTAVSTRKHPWMKCELRELHPYSTSMVQFMPAIMDVQRATAVLMHGKQLRLTTSLPALARPAKTALLYPQSVPV